MAALGVPLSGGRRSHSVPVSDQLRPSRRVALGRGASGHLLLPPHRGEPSGPLRSRGEEFHQMRVWAQSVTAALLVVLVAALATVTADGGSSASGAGSVRMVQTTQQPPHPGGHDASQPRLRPHRRHARRRPGRTCRSPVALLADQGMEFTDAISPHPLCCPARAQLATGQYAQNNGVQHNRGVHGGFQALDPTRGGERVVPRRRLPHGLRRQVPQRLRPARRPAGRLVALGRADPRRLRLRRTSR